MTKVEMSAALLAEEVENFIALGAPVTTTVVTALNQLKLAMDEVGMAMPSGASAPITFTKPANSRELTEAQIRAIINSGN